jgi:hypothetical protein
MSVRLASTIYGLQLLTRRRIDVCAMHQLPGKPCNYSEECKKHAENLLTTVEAICRLFTATDVRFKDCHTRRIAEEQPYMPMFLANPVRLTSGQGENCESSGSTERQSTRTYPYMNTKDCGALCLEVKPLPSTLFCRMAVL